MQKLKQMEQNRIKICAENELLHKETNEVSRKAKTGTSKFGKFIDSVVKKVDLDLVCLAIKMAEELLWLCSWKRSWLDQLEVNKV